MQLAHRILVNLNKLWLVNLWCLDSRTLFELCVCCFSYLEKSTIVLRNLGSIDPLVQLHWTPISNAPTKSHQYNRTINIKLGPKS